MFDAWNLLWKNTKSFSLNRKQFNRFDYGIYLTVDFLIEINNIITVSYYITLKKVNVKLYELDKMYMDEDLTEDKTNILDELNEREITSTKIISTLLNKIHPFYDSNGRTCKILFANDDKIYWQI